MDQRSPSLARSDLRETFGAVRASLRADLIGRDVLIDRLLVALLINGHILIEGLPGLAKTRAVKLFANALSAEFARIQCTPDLLPADLTGTTIFRPQDGSFEFVAGPLFHNIILVDEINRAPPKVQSALLEAMGEQQISTGGVTRRLADPFLVAATQNPIEHEGTYPLPEAQLDRFSFFVDVPMPGTEEERAILDLALSERMGTDAQAEPPHLTVDLVEKARREVAEVYLSEAVRDYIVRLVAATRGAGTGGAAARDIVQPASPRGSICLAMAGKAAAWLDGRDHVVPDDVREAAGDVLCGRIGLAYRARAEGRTARQVLAEILDATPVV